MCTALRENTLDIAIVLTEGIIADISKGNPSKIMQWYVESPLIWGIHVSHDSEIRSGNDFENKKYAISRPGSGSHLMAYVDANKRGLDINESNFVVVGNLNGAVEALTNHEADLFFWEKFTTKPYVDNQKLRFIAECPTPWPCFAIAVTDKAYHLHKTEINSLIQLITDINKDFKHIPNIEQLIASHSNLNKEDVEIWLKTVKWKSNNEPINASIIQDVIQTLQKLNIIQTNINVSAVLPLR
jgi:ABC-type nitrate/sulfonate/bicarbonate transport system substrate-binding protein